LNDAQLVAAVLAGQANAERELYDRHVARVFRLAFRMAGDETLARDFTQDTFVRAFSKLADFRGEASLATWLHTIASSVILNGLKKVRRIRSREIDGDELPEVAITRREAEPDLKLKLARAIDALPDGYRAVFVMHDVEGYTHEEIGTALGIQSGTSKAQLFRARARLRSELAEFAGEWAS
jgi:RNA polymerase sigma-70 factor (ECF subfamily)